MDRYSIVKVIGKGTFGKAILVKEKESGKLYIMKQISISTLSKKERDEAINEVKVLSSLKHENIVSYVTSFMSDGNLCIIMQYASGGDLYQRIKQQHGRLLDEDLIMKWFVQLCLAVKHCHDRRILHRDLKTQNIFLDKDDNVQLGDFGISKMLQSTMECARTMVGTPYYLSPELCREEPYNNKSDIWSIGCILYELCTGKHAFEGANMKALIGKILRGIYPPISSRYSHNLRDLIDRMLQKSPRRRPSVNSILRLTFIQEHVKRVVSTKTYESLYGVSSSREQENVQISKPFTQANKQETKDFYVPISNPTSAPRVHINLKDGIVNNQHAKSNEKHYDMREDLKEKFKVYEDKKRELIDRFIHKNDKENDPLVAYQRSKEPELAKRSDRQDYYHQNVVLRQLLVDNNQQAQPIQRDFLKPEKPERISSNSSELVSNPLKDILQKPTKNAWEPVSNEKEEVQIQQKDHTQLDSEGQRKARIQRLNELQNRRRELEEREKFLEDEKKKLIEKQKLAHQQAVLDKISLQNQFNSTPTKDKITSDIDHPKKLSLKESNEKGSLLKTSPAKITPLGDNVKYINRPKLTQTVRSSVHKFKLNGATFKGNGVNDFDSLCYRIESLRVYLESKLGTKTFYEAYNLIKACDNSIDDDEVSLEKIEKVLQKENLCYLSLIHQLMFCEDTFNEEQ